MLKLSRVGTVFAVLVSCAGSPEGHEPDLSIRESDEAAVRAEQLRERFRVGDGSTSVIGSGVANRFVLIDEASDTVRVHVAGRAKRAVARTATVELPSSANGFVRVEDDESRLSVRFALQGASESTIATADGLAVYFGALAGADVVHRPHAEGTEDFVVFEHEPEVEELRYLVDVSRVAGLRLVSNTLEFLDGGGAPRLRVAPPYVVDANGETHSAALSVDGCEYDSSPAAPWGRMPTSPRAERCLVRVEWANVAYPAIVDPDWVGTGATLAKRHDHTASVLPSGQVLISGGTGLSFKLPGDTLSVSELYDPATSTFAAAAPLAEERGRTGHTATRLQSGKILLVGGGYYPGAHSNVSLTTAELYDPVEGTFAPTGSLMVPRNAHTATLLSSGEVLIMGGFDHPPSGGYEVHASCERYNPVTGAFSNAGTMEVARQSHTASLLESAAVLVAGGSDTPGSQVASAELYSPAMESFSTVDPMSHARLGHSATVLQSGLVLIAGGSESINAELYDPVAKAFLGAGPMMEARSGHTATLLASGRVLVAGGSDAKQWGARAAEVFDPTTMVFDPIEPMLAGRERHAATSIGASGVLLTGGIMTFDESTINAEVYVAEPGGGAIQAGSGGDATSSGVDAGGTGGGGGVDSARVLSVERGGCSCTQPAASSGSSTSMYLAMALGFVSCVVRTRRRSRC